MSGILEIRGLSFAYSNAPILENIDLTLAAGEFLGVIGPNGGGKSTLLKIIMGLLPPRTGHIAVLGQAPAAARSAIGYLAQAAGIDHDFPITAEEIVMQGRLHPGAFFYRRQDREAARQIMAELEILPLCQRRINTLSGGQAQRVLLARALAAEPKLLILDEPTSNLDMRIEEEMFALLRRLSQRVAVIVASHNFTLVDTYAHRIACLNRVMACHAAGTLGDAAIHTLYGGRARAGKRRELPPC